jgi:hypothetical protein
MQENFPIRLLIRITLRIIRWYYFLLIVIAQQDASHFPPYLTQILLWSTHNFITFPILGAYPLHFKLFCFIYLYFLFVSWSGVQPSPVLMRPLLAYCTSPGWWWVWSNRSNSLQGNLSARRNPAPVPLCSLQIPRDLTRARTRAATLRSQRLISWATARLSLPRNTLLLQVIKFHIVENTVTINSILVASAPLLSRSSSSLAFFKISSFFIGSSTISICGVGSI